MRVSASFGSYRRLFACVVGIALIGFGGSAARAEAGAYAYAERIELAEHPAAAEKAEVAQAPVGGPLPTPAPEAGDDTNDPLEPLNRAIFGANQAFLDYILEPITITYETVVPSLVRQAIHNLLNHLSSPVILANDVLQGEGKRAMETLGRMVVNTTIGIGGLVDAGAELGVKRHSEDFGQTLGVWGVGEGLYVVLPLFGPSNPRDAVGKLLVDSYLDPFGLYLSNTDRDDWGWARTGVGAVDEYSGVREDLAQVRKTSIDYYAAIRSLYRQKRKAEISNGRDLDLPPIPDLTTTTPETPNLRLGR